MSERQSPLTAPRKKQPKTLAVIDADHCTGCAACIEVCPVDCIELVPSVHETPGLFGWCEIDWDRCIGCKLCIRLPKKKSEAHTNLVCPWDAIEMVSIENLPDAARAMGGPPELGEQRDKTRTDAAHRQVILLEQL